MKNMMSGYLARKSLIQAYELENSLRHIICGTECDHELNHVLKELQKLQHHRALAVVDSLSNTKVRPLELVRNDAYNQQLQKPSTTDKHHTIATSRRDRVKRLFLKRKQISTKAPLDETYLDTFLVPDYYMARENMIMENKKARELENGPAKVRIRVITTPRGPYSYMTVQGRHRHPHLTRSRHISRLLRDKKPEQIEAINVQLEKASKDLQWKDMIAKNTFTEEGSWIQSLIVKKQALMQASQLQRRRLYKYRTVLISHKLELDNIMLGKHMKTKIKWANYKSRVPHTTRLKKTQCVNSHYQVI